MSYVPQDAAVVTIGNFDGVHRGHQWLLQQVVDRAHFLGVRGFAVTFDPHPERVLFPHRALSRLTDTEERVALIKQVGIDDVWVCSFTLEIARMDPGEFIQLVLARQPIAELWVGADFAMGRGRSGTIAVLAELGGAMGWGVHMVPPFRLNGQAISSTAIRTLLAAGAVQGAAELLGRNVMLPGVLEHDPSGAATVQVVGDRATPRPGLYVGRVYAPPTDAESGRDAIVLVIPAAHGSQNERHTLQLTWLDQARPLPQGKARVEFLARVRPIDEGLLRTEAARITVEDEFRARNALTTV